LVLERKIEEAKKLLPQIYKILDKAAKEKVIKKNTAARKKSRIAKAIERSK
jgi:ribosomal protein S20